MEKIIAIVGPTASGKTGLAVALAKKFNGEIISADSRQIFQGLDIGSGKERDLGVPQHLLDLLKPGDPVNVAWFQEKAYEAIEQVRQRGALPLVTGGSMQYVSAVCEGYVFGGRGFRKAKPRYEVLTIGLNPDRELLRENILSRTKGWVEAGLEGEVRGLLTQGVSEKWIDALGLEYRAFLQYVNGALTLYEAIEKSVTWQMQYAKRQMTWWRHHGSVAWVDGVQHAENLVEAFLS